MNKKWVEYALVGIQVYITIDAWDVSPNKKSRMIIGYLDRALRPNPGQISAFAFPESISRGAFNDLYVLASQYKDQLYYINVFQEIKIIDFTFLDHIGLSPDMMQTPSRLKIIARTKLSQSDLSFLEIQEYLDALADYARYMESHQRSMSETEDALRREHKSKLGVGETAFKNRKEKKFALQGKEQEGKKKEAALQEKEVAVEEKNREQKKREQKRKEKEAALQERKRLRLEKEEALKGIRYPEASLKQRNGKSNASLNARGVGDITDFKSQSNVRLMQRFSLKSDFKSHPNLSLHNKKSQRALVDATEKRHNFSTDWRSHR